jgi:O-antigen/teichoic acid export membrane protein
MKSIFIKSSLWNFSSNLAIRFSSLIIFPILVRYYQKGDLAYFKSLQSLLVIIFNVIPVGLHFLYIKSNTKEEDNWNNLLSFSIISTIFISIILLFCPLDFIFKDISFNPYILKIFLIMLTYMQFLKVILHTILTKRIDFKTISHALMFKQMSLYLFLILFIYIQTNLLALFLSVLFSELLEFVLLLTKRNAHNPFIFNKTLSKITLSHETKMYLTYSGLDQFMIILAIQFPTIFFVTILGPDLAPEIQLPFVLISAPISLILISVSKVIFPYLSNLSTSANYKKVVLKSMKVMTLLILPILLSISFFSNEIVNLIFRENWIYAKFVLRFLPLIAIPELITNPTSSIAILKNKPYINLLYSTTLLIFRISSIYFGYHHFGKFGMVFIYIISEYIVRIIRIFVDFKLLSITFKELIDNTYEAFIFSLSLYIVLYYFSQTNNFYSVIIFLFLAVLYFYFKYKKELFRLYYELK